MAGPARADKRENEGAGDDTFIWETRGEKGSDVSMGFAGSDTSARHGAAG